MWVYKLNIVFLRQVVTLWCTHGITSPERKRMSSTLADCEAFALGTYFQLTAIFLTALTDDEKSFYTMGLAQVL